MACFNRIYSAWGTQPVDPNSKVTVREASQSCGAKTVRWLKWLVTLPITIPHMAYTAYLMTKHQEMIAPIRAHFQASRSIHLMASPTGHLHIISSPEIWNAIAKLHRTDTQGPLADINNGRLFLPLLRDLYPGETVTQDDFLFTCHRERVDGYRDPILEFFGPKNLPTLRNLLKEVVQGAMAYLKEQEKSGVVTCSAQELSEIFTVGVVSRLLLGHSANFESYKPIGDAISLAMEYAMMKFIWMKPTKEQTEAYQEALKVLRSTLDSTSGDFSDSLKAAEMSPIQIKGMLLLMYIAGSETSATLLQYMLWQIGQNGDCQEKIFREVASNSSSSVRAASQSVEQVFQESIRLHPPAAIIGRIARIDLDICVANKDGSSWVYPIAKGHNLLYSPYLAGRNPNVYPSPESFDPKRFEGSSSSQLPWAPFNKGVHLCPGKWLAQEEIKTFIETLVKRYEIASSCPEGIKQKGLMTLRMGSTVALTLTSREKREQWAPDLALREFF